MKLCIDTCAYSRLALHHPDLVRYIEEADAVYVPAVVIGELFTGFMLGKRERENRTQLDAFLDLPGISVTSVDISIAERYAGLVKQLRQQGTPIPTNDIWIAATAFETGARLVTYDAHFSNIPGLMIIAP